MINAVCIIPLLMEAVYALVDIGAPDTTPVEERDTTPQPRLGLYLKGPGLPGVSSDMRPLQM